MKTKPRVTRKDFLYWLFSNSEDAKDLGYKVIEELQSSGACTITVKQLFYGCGYIPSHILENKEEFGEDDDFKPSEVEFIN